MIALSIGDATRKTILLEGYNGYANHPNMSMRMPADGSFGPASGSKRIYIGRPRPHPACSSSLQVRQKVIRWLFSEAVGRISRGPFAAPFVSEKNSEAGGASFSPSERGRVIVGVGAPAVRSRAPGLSRSESAHPCGREHRALRLLEQRFGVDAVLGVDFVENRPHDLR